jgi:hypothetical protein
VVAKALPRSRQRGRLWDQAAAVGQTSDRVAAAQALACPQRPRARRPRSLLAVQRHGTRARPQVRAVWSAGHHIATKRADGGYLLTSLTAAAGPGCCRGARRDALMAAAAHLVGCGSHLACGPAGHRGEAWLETRPSEPALKLLHAVPEHQSAYETPCRQLRNAHLSSFR